MNFGKVFLFLSGLSLGYFLTNLKGTVMNDYLYLFIGIVGGYFLFNFIPYYFTADEPPKPTLTDPAGGGMGSGEALKEITVKKVFKASIFGDPLTPDEVIFDKKGITFNVKNFFGNVETFVLYSDVSGVEIVEGIILSTIKIKPKTRNTDIKIDNFAKADAKVIKKLILEKL
ncbi:MAG: hypothetical protein KBA66_08695 [Leptospiraceae bacterium]|nr:hypothetical protein [Leptospiraceae bacterium]